MSDVQVFPATPAQQRFWVLDQLDPGSAAYTIPVALRLRGALDAGALRGALEAVVARHEALRTVFALEGDEAVQVVGAPGPFALPLRDLSALPAEERARAASDAATAAANAPFDLARGPLVRAELLRLAADEHVLLLTLHHAVADGTSVGIVFRETAAAYAALVAGAAPSFPPLPLQYADFAVWQREALAGAGAARQLAYWAERLRALPVLEMPADRPRPASLGTAGAKREAPIPADVVEGARALGRREGATAYATFLAAWVALLHRYTAQPDIVVGSVVAGRERAEVEGVVGLFLNTLPIRANVEGDPTFTELLARVREAALGALANADVPFERMVEAAGAPRDPARSPVFQAAFQLLENVGGELRIPGVIAEPVEREKRTAKFELTLMLNAAPGGALRAVLEYSTELYDERTADRLLAHYAALLAEAVRAPEARVSRLPLLGAAERAAVLAAAVAAPTPLPAWTTPACVLARAAEAPDAVAVVAPDARLTYGELARRSAIVARRLAAAGVRPGDAVAVCMERTSALVVALLGVLRAGAAYVPVDPAYPVERVAHVLGDASARSALADARSRASVAGAEAVLEVSDAWWADEIDEAAAFAAPALDGESLAYVIYTSGSTGAPKGVMIPHRALANFLASMAAEPGLAASDAVVAVTTVSFDIAGLELWLPLVTGAEVVLASRETAADGRALGALLDATATRVAGRALLQATPATWRLLVEAGWAGAPNVVMLCGGEAWPAGLAGALLPRGAALWNVYGPTETTIWSALARVDREGALSLGGPLANTALHVLEPSGEVAPPGVPGELWIGGAGLARGYRGRDDLTAERFAEHPALGRLYRTGDRARRRGDLALEYLGRLDDQVKVRGFRIELGEVEAAVAGAAGVRQAVAAARADGGEARVVAYVVLADGADAAAAAADVRERARRALPDYMVPSAVVVLDALPLTPNGKVDRRALPAPSAADAAAHAYVAPRSPLEAQIAGVWADVLGVERVGADDDFFALGGHSLLAMRVVGRLADALPVRLTIGALFEARTVAGLAEAVTRRLAEPAPAAGTPAAASSADGGADGADGDDISALLAELEGLSDDDVARLLAESEGAA